MGISDITKKLIGDKRRWRAYRARIRALPETYRTAASGIERYVMYTGPGDGDALMTMLDDLAVPRAASTPCSTRTTPARRPS